MSTSNNWDKEQLTSRVLAKHTECKRTVSIDAANFADARASAQQVEMYLKGIKGQYDGFYAEVRHAIQAQTERAHDAIDTEEAAKEEESNTEKIQEAKETVRVAKVERRNFVVAYDWKSLWWKVLLEVFVFVAEVSYNSVAFAVSGSILLFTIIPALVVSVSLCAIALYIPKYLQNKTGKERKVAIRTIMFGMLIVFVALGTLRALSMIGDGTFSFTVPVLVGTLIFIVLNFVIFGGAVIIGMSLPSKEDRRVKSEYDRLSSVIRGAEDKVEQYEEANRILRRKASEKRKERLLAAGMEAHFFELIKALCDETVHLFFKEYFIRRPGDASNILHD